MKSKIQNIAILTIVLIVLRCMVETNEQCTLIVSVINVIALLVVVYLITEQIESGIISKIKEFNVPKQIEKREIRVIKRKIVLIIYVPFLLASVAFLVFLSSGLGNDIVGIISLGMSLCDDHIVAIATSLYRKKD